MINIYDICIYDILIHLILFNTIQITVLLMQSETQKTEDKSILDRDALTSGYDPRSMYFKPEEIKFVDSVWPLLIKNGLNKEAKRLCDCGAKYNLFHCDNAQHAIKQFAFPYRCELRVCPRCNKGRGFLSRKRMIELLKYIEKTKTHKFALLTLTLKMSENPVLSKGLLRDFNKKVRKLVNALYPKSDNCGA